MGAETRRLVDQVQAAALSGAAELLQPGVTMLVERIEPQWCSGFLGYYELESGNVQDLYVYMKETWGGRRYKLTALSVDGKPAWDMRLNISGVPLDEGQAIDRVQYLGLPTPATTTAPAQQHYAPPQQPQQVDALAIARLVLEAQREGAKERTQGFEALVSSQAEQTRGLVEAVTRRDQDREQRSSFRTQLNEVVEASQELEQVRRVLAPEPRASRREESEPEDPMRGALREASKDFLSSFAASRLTRMGAPPRAGAPTHAREAQQKPAENTDIPAGVPSGQKRGR